MPDIDIDFADRNQILQIIPHIQASRIEDGKLVKHNTGIYLQKTPIDLFENVCKIPYNETSFFKIDFLNVHLYKDVKNEDHLFRLMNQEPIWELLEQDDFVNLLFHINGHGKILKEMKPRDIPQLAAVLAMIRPSKRHLIGKPWTFIMEEIWIKPDNEEYYFKKSHATAYAVAIVIQMNLICESISYGYS